MIHSVLSKILVLLIMLSFLGQGLLSDGHWMVAEAAEPQQTMVPQMQQSGCHDTADETKDVQQSDIAHSETHQSNHCCNGSEQCSDDCKHCLVIATTANLHQAKSWPGFSPSEPSLATAMPHFHSIDLTKNLRPPIV